MASRRAVGDNLAEAAAACLDEAGMGGGGSGLGPSGPSASRDVDRLREPDCQGRGGLGGGVPSTVAYAPKPNWTFGSVQIHELDDGSTMYWTEHESASGASRFEVSVYDSEGRLVHEESGTRNEHGEVKVRESTTYTYDDEGNVTTRSQRWENGRRTEDTTTGPETTEEDASPQPTDTESTGQPGPECQLDGTCPVEDPRCAPAPNDIGSLWDCQAETDFSLQECLHRMRDAIYVTTGGRCERAVGPDDAPTIRCHDRSFAECLAAGGTVEECMGQNPGYGGDGVPEGPEGDDLFVGRFGRRTARGVLYIDTTPMGAVFAGFCAHGAEQFCRNSRGAF